MPSVVNVSLSERVPLGFDKGAWEGLDVQGYVPSAAENMKIWRNLISPGYFEAMRIPLLAGRDFTLRDSELSQRVAIINQSFAHRFFGDSDVIGRKIKGWGEWITIVGVVRDSKYQNITEAPLPFLYVPLAQHFSPAYTTYFNIRTKGNPASLIEPVRRLLQSQGGLGVNGVLPLSDYIGAAYFSQKLAASVLTAMASISVVLALLGLYGVIAYSVARRTHEIGIRVAIGASPENVLRMIVGDGLRLAVAGLCAGVVLSVAGGRIASSLLYRVSGTDAEVFAGSSFFVLVLTVFISAIPAMRASRFDPLLALREE
jgi:predicted permease